MVSRFSVEKSFLTKAKNFAGQLCCAVFLKSCGSENFMNKGGGGLSRFSVEHFISHSAEKIRGATLLCSVSEICR